MYSLHMPIVHDYDSDFSIVESLFKEVFGYTNEEIQQFADTMFMCCVAQNLTIEQVKLIVKPFYYDNGVNIYLKEGERYISYREAGINLTKEPPKDHYYDQPVVSRNQLVDPFTQKEKERQENYARQAMEERITKTTVYTPKCPTCQSTNIRKMSGVERGASIWAFGLFSKKINKTFKCGNCGMTF